MTRYDFQTRQAIRQSLADELSEGSLVNITEVQTHSDNQEVPDGTTRLISDELRGLASLTNASAAYAGQYRVILAHDPKTGTVDVKALDDVSLGVLEIWRKPHNARKMSSLISIALDEAIESGYMVETLSEDWLLPQYSSLIRVPGHISKVASVHAPSPNDISIRRGQNRSYQPTAPAASYIEASQSRLNVTDAPAGSLIASINTEFSESINIYNTVLIGITSNSNIDLRMTDGNTDRTITMFADSPRVIAFPHKGGIKSSSEIQIYSAEDSEVSFSLDFSRNYYFVQSRIKGGLARLLNSRWQADTLTRHLRVNTNMLGAVRVEYLGYRQPGSIRNDTDVVECPASAIVAIVKGKLLADSQPNPTIDVGGVIQRTPWL